MMKNNNNSNNFSKPQLDTAVTLPATSGVSLMQNESGAHGQNGILNTGNCLLSTSKKRKFN